jgi:hypothetical protein
MRIVWERMLANECIETLSIILPTHNKGEPGEVAKTQNFLSDRRNMLVPVCEIDDRSTAQP